MADQQAKIDRNRTRAAIAESDSTGETRPLLVDELTGRLKVDSTGTSTGTQYTEGDSVSGDATGTLAMGESPTNTIEPQQLDATGNLKVTIEADNAGIGGGTQYNTNTAYSDGNTGNLSLTVRDDSLSDLTEAEGDYSTMKVDKHGALWIREDAEQSDLGVNSSNEASNGSYSNWSTNTWTGTYEQNNYQYVVVSLHTDDDGGNLYFDFSPDGTNTNTFPVAGFTIAEGIHEIHVAVKSSRYFRPRYVGTGNRTYFRLYTYYTNTSLQLNSPLNTSMSADVDGAVVKSAHVVQYYPEPSTVAEGDYDTPSITRHREVRTRDQRHVHFQECEDSTEFTALGNDTLNLADSTNHIYGQYSLSFDKVNGADNTVIAGVSTTTFDTNSGNIDEIFEEGGFISLGTYLPSVADVNYVFVRFGTDSSNYNEWRWDVADLSAGQWLVLRKSVGSPDTYAGNGWNTTNIQYLAFGVAFNAETDTLSGILFDNVGFVAGRVTDTTLDATVTSSVNTPNINLHRVGGTPTDANTGNASAGTQRVVIASDQPSVTVDDGGTSLTVDGSVSVSSSALPTGASTAANQSTIIGHVDGIEGLLTTIDADTSSLAGAVSGSEVQVDVVGSLPAGTNAIGKLSANDGVDIGDVSINNTVSIESDGTALGNGQVSVGTTAGGTTIASASAGRQGVIVTNQGSIDVYIGTGTVTTANGFLLRPNESVGIPSDSDIKGITGSSTTTVGYLSFG